MSKHTPGPWITNHRKGSDSMYRTEVFSEEHGGIATCDWTPKNCGNGVTKTYREANARLISAAPDLLEALQKIAAIENKDFGNDWEEIDEARAIARAAIAKATGEQS